MMLEDKVAVVYGAGGAIGGTVARAFAAEGAHVFLAGRAEPAVAAVAGEITAVGGVAEAAAVDALDERAVDHHLSAVADRTGRIDISFNAVGIGDAALVGLPLAEMDVARFTRPIVDYTTSYFVTARAAARHMLAARAGVIMTVSAVPARTGTVLNGGYGPAQAAKEALTRDLSAELAPHGIRVVALRPHGLPETSTMREIFDAKAGNGATWEQFQGRLATMSHTNRVMTLDEVAGAAVFAASDRASGMTGTTINLTMGGFGD